MGLPHWAQRGSRSVCVRASIQERQNGMALPVSRIRAQIRHGAGKTSEASASHIPRKWDRKESATRATVRQAYPGRGFRESKICHDSCQRGFSGAGFSLWVLVLASTNPHRLKPAPLEAAEKAPSLLFRANRGFSPCPKHKQREIPRHEARLGMTTLEVFLGSCYRSPCSCFSAQSSNTPCCGVAAARCLLVGECGRPGTRCQGKKATLVSAVSGRAGRPRKDLPAPLSRLVARRVRVFAF